MSPTKANATNAAKATNTEQKETMVARAMRERREQGELPSALSSELDALITTPMTGAQLNELTNKLKRAVIERALKAEMSQHLGYAQDEIKPEGQANYRNGTSKKTLITDSGPLAIDIPRDRDGGFEPLVVPKHGRRYHGFDEHILSMYARGMSVRDIAAHLKHIYQIEVSAEFISVVTDEIMQEVAAWQNRALERLYPVIFFDALRVKIRDDGSVKNKAIYLALGVQTDGSRDILGLWIEQSEGAKFWLKVFNDLKTRGVEDVLIAVTDGLKGIPEALASAFPRTTLQTCIVHLIRNSLDYASWKDRKALAAALKPIYTAVDADAAQRCLCAFEEGQWGTKLPHVASAWRRAWEQVIPFFSFAPEIRRIIYTTNAIESVNARIRKVIKTRGHFPTDEAATKLIWLALNNITADWSMPVFHWKAAMAQFAIIYEERFTKHIH
jgi:putative transposase